MVTEGKTQDQLNAESEWNKQEHRRNWAEKVIYSMLIPVVWYSADRHGVVLDTGKHCWDRGYLNGDKLSPYTEEKTWVCYKNKLYYFVSPSVGFCLALTLLGTKVAAF